MKLHSSHPFWPLVHGLLTVVPPLGHDLECAVLVVGTGITGALVADTLCSAGVDVAVIDKRDLAQGSTSASTALLQYDIDVPLVTLERQMNPAFARRAYQAGAEAIELLGHRCRSLPEARFARRSSLYFTRDGDDIGFMKSELEARRRAGFDVRWLGARQLRDDWGIAAPGAIHSTQAAQVDPYALTHALLRACLGRGVPIYDRTELVGIEEDARGVSIFTDRARIRARWLVMATGYESVAWIKQRVVDLDSTFALVSEPVDESMIWRERSMIWEHADPYLYARWTDDNRLLLGGADIGFKNETWRDRLIKNKTRALLRDMKSLCPGLRFEPAFAWAGTFGKTADGLAYIGASGERRRVLFALGFGGNGITYSQIASRMILEQVQGRTHPDAAIFSFNRL